MTTTSNLYADKVYAEHPNALYALDESADYVSMITDAQRTISTGNGWTLSNVTSTNSFTDAFPVAQLDTVINEIVLPDLGSPPTTLEKTNLVTNPSFETGTTSWAINNNAALVKSSEQFYTVASSLKITRTGAADDFVYFTATGLTPGQTYTGSFYAYITGDGATASNRGILVYGGTGGTSFSMNYDRTKTDQWQRVFASATVGSGGTFQIRAHPMTDFDVFIDAAMIESGSTLTDYFDGSNTSGSEEGEYVYAWTEGVNASTSTKSLIGTPPSQTSTLTSPVLRSGPTISNDTGSFAIGAYIYPFYKKITAEIGYTYTDLTTSLPVMETRSFSIVDVEQWQFVSETFATPTNFSNLKVIVKITYSGPSGPPAFPSSYSVLVHGLTIGQQSEEFNVESLGNVPVSIPSTISPIISGTGVPANKYGLQTVSGYYMAEGDRLTAINSGMPMVFGASNSTRIIPRNNGDDPSLVIPGENFFNSAGRYGDMTAEFWIRIQTQTTTPRKIFGPIASDDGLYVHDGFLSLKLNKEFGTYYISEWDRPMLIAIRLSANSASVTINGEQTIGLDFVDSDVVFPDHYLSGKDQNWLGFYAYYDVPLLEVDSISIYPYSVPNIVEKRRWVYGQGVEPIQNVIGTDISESVLIDYSFANYGKNYLYPDIGRWQQGINENLLIENNAISNINYVAPDIKLSSKQESEWYADNEAVQEEESFISLRPNSSWDSVSGHLAFNTLNPLSQDLRAFYALLASDASNTNKQTIFFIENSVTKDVLEVTLEGSTLKYSFTSGDGLYVDYTLYSQTDHIPGTYIAAGIDISKFSSSFEGKLVAFFGSKQNLKLFVGGNKNLDLSSTFSGKIYRVGFCTARNFKKIQNSFLDNGVLAGYSEVESLLSQDAGDKNFGNTTNYVDPETSDIYWSSFADADDTYFGNSPSAFGEVFDGGSPYSILSDLLLFHTASYTLVPKIFLGKFYIDIASNGYWQDYVPLSYFTKYVLDGNNEKYQDVDFIQFNINYPQIARYLESAYDFNRLCVKTYVSFQYLKNSSTIDPESFVNHYNGLVSGVIIPESDWESSIYEITNDTIIYPPPAVDFNTIGMVLHVEIISSGIVENPIKINSLQLSSQSLNGFRPNPVGTKLGTDIFPYRKSAEYFDYKGKNPYSIYKGTTPYFYLTSTSGIKLKPLDLGLDRGISVPINKKANSFYKVSSVQLAMRWEDATFPTTPVELFEIKSTYQNIKVYVDADGYAQNRGRLYAVNAFTGQKQDGVTFYLNGRRVKTAMLNARTWSIIGVSFSSALDFSNEVGAFRMTGTALFNNLSFFQITEQEETSNFSYRKWFNISAIDGVGKDWAYWKNLQVIPGQLYTWRDVLFIASAKSLQVSPADTYKRYTGTDRFVVDTDKKFQLKDYRYLFYNSVEWKSAVVPAV